MEVRCYSRARIRHVSECSDRYATPGHDVRAATLRRSPTGRRILVGSEVSGLKKFGQNSDHRSAAWKVGAGTATRDPGRLTRTERAVLDRQDTKARSGFGGLLTISSTQALTGLQRMHIHSNPSSRLSMAPAVRISVAPYVIEEGAHETNACQCNSRGRVARCSG
jgi:hypothetical protein